MRPAAGRSSMPSKGDCQKGFRRSGERGEPSYEAETNGNGAGSGAAGDHAVGNVRGHGHGGSRFEGEQIVNIFKVVKPSASRLGS